MELFGGLLHMFGAWGKVLILLFFANEFDQIAWDIHCALLY